jgi:hypothetical protein
MEVNEYMLEILVREKLDEARAMTARRALVRGSRPPRAPLRARVGAALIAFGERVAGPAAGDMNRILITTESRGEAE